MMLTVPRCGISIDLSYGSGYISYLLVFAYDTLPESQFDSLSLPMSGAERAVWDLGFPEGV